ncbi:hypothetical protein OG819_16715 [Streptomyces sp. NBC_01549]|uniref:hypothetical protein n=1 Tax=Streptomyces sp. NBC_01549 TaxID=2975874 RepID=UPI0022592DD7|nr:hypothetical protein [Streptomyces sp. NBC_01549]MCX4591326.1 hypothetical protein [Streptomyces sp. NBC_01549]
MVLSNRLPEDMLRAYCLGFAETLTARAEPRVCGRFVTRIQNTHTAATVIGALKTARTVIGPGRFAWCPGRI